MTHEASIDLCCKYLELLDQAFHQYLSSELKAIKAQHEEVLRKMERKLETLQLESEEIQPQELRNLVNLQEIDPGLLRSLLSVEDELKQIEKSVKSPEKALDLMASESEEYQADIDDQQVELENKIRQTIMQFDKEFERKKYKLSLTSE